VGVTFVFSALSGIGYPGDVLRDFRPRVPARAHLTRSCAAARRQEAALSDCPSIRPSIRSDELA
jgi:hypothetical protein